MASLALLLCATGMEPLVHAAPQPEARLGPCCRLPFVFTYVFIGWVCWLILVYYKVRQGRSGSVAHTQQRQDWALSVGKPNEQAIVGQQSAARSIVPH